jgi:hypothetical protein
MYTQRPHGPLAAGNAHRGCRPGLYLMASPVLAGVDWPHRKRAIFHSNLLVAQARSRRAARLVALLAQQASEGAAARRAAGFAGALAHAGSLLTVGAARIVLLAMAKSQAAVASGWLASGSRAMQPSAQL